MYVDALTLSAVVAELRDTVMNGHIQRVLQPTPDTLGFEIYAGRRYTLLLSAHPQRARIQITQTKLTRGTDADTPLLLLLRKYAKNGVITAVRQPPLERVVVLSITKYPGPRKDEADEDDVSETRHTELIIEILGGRSNIVLVDADGRVLDAIKRVGAEQRRPMLPRMVYMPPLPAPAQGDPRSATAAGLRAELQDGDDVVKGIVGAYRGVSPLVAREAVFRALGETSLKATPELSLDAIAAELSALYHEPHAPSLALDDGQPVAFGPYHLDQYPDVVPYDSIGAVMDVYFGAVDKVGGHAARRAALVARLNDVRTRYSKQRDALARELERAQSIDRLRWEGEMIYGYAHSIVPGQTVLDVEDEHIKLDPNKTVTENAQERFRAYDKAKGALAGVPERLAEAEGQVAYLDETLAMLDLAESFDEITTIEREAEREGVLKAPVGSKPGRGPRAKPLRVVSSEGVPIWVGRSAGQNEEVTFTLAQPNDVWLHARGVPGAHVVIRWDGPVGDQTLLEAAGLALYFSKARNQTAADVQLAQRRDIRKVSGGPPGLVAVRNERTLRARPIAPGEVGAGDEE